jgi:DNA-binding beta-propeller fold protein YncE
MTTTCPLVRIGILGVATLALCSRTPGTVAAAAGSQAPPLVAQPAVVVPGGPGGFDYMQVDAPLDRLLAAHTGKNALAILNLATGALISQVETGRAQGVAVDVEDNKYFVSVSREQRVAIIDRKTLAKTGEIPLAGPADAIVFNPKNHCVYACHDDGTHVWVIDGRTDRLTATVTIPEGPEYIVYDPVSDRVYQNIKGNDTVQVIDPSTNAVTEHWSTAPATAPHGLAVEGRTHRLFSAGANGKLSVIDARSGKNLAVVEIAPRADQIAFDAPRRRIYCACRGTLSVVEVTEDGARSLGNLAVPAGVHTLAVDPKTHAVWVSYADASESYVMKLTPPR